MHLFFFVVVRFYDCCVCLQTILYAIAFQPADQF